MRSANSSYCSRWALCWNAVSPTSDLTTPCDWPSCWGAAVRITVWITTQTAVMEGCLAAHQVSETQERKISCKTEDMEAGCRCIMCVWMSMWAWQKRQRVCVCELIEWWTDGPLAATSCVLLRLHFTLFFFALLSICLSSALYWFLYEKWVFQIFIFLTD